MSLLLNIVTKFPYAGLLDRDCSENSWWFNIPGVSPEAEVNAARDGVIAFYQAPDDVYGKCIINMMPPWIDWGAVDLQVRFVDEATGVQTGETIHNIGDWFAEESDGNSAFPAEVAFCQSFRSDVTAGLVPARRRRGRVYLGPLSPDAGMVSTADPYSRPGPALRGAGITGCVALFAATTGDPTGVEWVVYSRPVSAAQAAEAEHDYPGTSVTERDGLAHRVTACWNDDEWDTQRRRGADPTSRAELNLDV